ncbi:MAG: 30S ribosomal protein S16 [Candidatus Omnitrophica bacterium]|nr:30S ribosomal protein S16 [Candidatus Omnitrophota bacterium]MCM8826825.1 30S ribosomal protein S16 [Candidatus Omnitrophota bacterium]
MLRIRLMRPGKSVKGRTHFKMVVMERRRARDSKFVEQIGYYDPKRSLLKVDLEKYEKWSGRGALPTETVVSLVKRYRKSLNGSKTVSQ